MSRCEHAWNKNEEGDFRGDKPMGESVITALSDALKLVGQAYIALSGGASSVRHRPAWPNLAKFTFSARDGVEAGANMVWEGSIDT